MINLPNFEFNRFDPDKEQEGISEEETLTLLAYRERMEKLQAELEATKKSVAAILPKAEAFDVVTQALDAAGFDPEKMTYIDQARMVIQLSVADVDTVLAQKLSLLDTCITNAHTQIAQKVNKLSEIIDNASASQRSIRKVQALADNARGEISYLVGEQLESRVRWHENQWHDARHNMREDKFDLDDEDQLDI